MAIQIQSVRREHFDDWLRLREAVYFGIDRLFHQREMELFLGEENKECFLALTESGDACGMIEVSLRNNGGFGRSESREDVAKTFGDSRRNRNSW